MRKVIAFILIVALSLSIVGAVDLNVANKTTAEASVDVSQLKAEDMLDMDGLVGWATVEGEGVETVTGGGDVPPVVVTDYETFYELANDNIPRVIIVSGTIDTVGKAVDVGSNKTIIGIDENATLIGGISVKGACNVIISNLNIKGIWPATALPDALSIENSHHVWADHLNIWDAPDGNLDIKGSSNYITVSWCKFWYTSELHEHRLSNLVSSGTHNDATELHHLNVTYHHNWFADLIMQRMPRLLYGKGHIYNNYYTAKGSDYCIGVGCYASALIEGNYFKDSNNPHQVMYQGIIATYITARDTNIYDNTTGKKQSGYFKGSSGFTAMEPEEFDNPPYTYYLDEAKDIPDFVQAYVGPQNVLESENPDKPKLGPAVTPYPEPEVTKDPVVFPTDEPEVDDNPITYDSENGIYNYNGTNSDNTNGKLDVTNPFAGMDLSETVEYDENGYPVWDNGVTISYWVKMPELAKDIPVLNFNLKDDREIDMSEKDMYEICKEAEAGTGSYKITEINEYYTMSGNLVYVLAGQGRHCRYNPLFPKSGAYKLDSSGDIAVYQAGADTTNPDSYELVTKYEDGYYPYYGLSFDEEGGEESLLPEAYIDGSLSLYASGSVGYARDNGTGRQINPNLDNYGKPINIDENNYFRYWGNGGAYSPKNALTVPTMETKDEWHFVVTVIKNDWIQTYVDGIKMDEDYISVAGSKLYEGVAGNGFNLGYGSSAAYISSDPDDEKAYGDTILDLITNENTTLSIGGTGLAVSKLRQGIASTFEGSQVKDIRFYSVALSDENVGKDRVQTFTKGWKLEGTELIEIEADSEPVPTPVPTDTPKPTDTPEPAKTPEPPVPWEALGDVDINGNIDAADALLVLKHAAKLYILKGQSLEVADTTAEGNIDAADALKILKYAAKLINEM